MADIIEVGDVVCLKSGGPRMAATMVEKDALEVITAWCDWFEDHEQKQSNFPVTSLESDAGLLRKCRRTISRCSIDRAGNSGLRNSM
jgi:uncharacterized protein YodC (DUF2158 family)